MHIDPNRNILILREEWGGVEEKQKGENEQINPLQALLPEKDSPTLPYHQTLLPTTPHFLGLFNTSSSTLIISEFHCLGKWRLIAQQNLNAKHHPKKSSKETSPRYGLMPKPPSAHPAVPRGWQCAAAVPCARPGQGIFRWSQHPSRGSSSAQALPTANCCQPTASKQHSSIASPSGSPVGKQTPRSLSDTPGHPLASNSGSIKHKKSSVL